jgi:hypothetical protein
MALSRQEIIDSIKSPKAAASLAKAVRHERRLRFHAEEVSERTDASPYLSDFLSWVSSLLPADKAAMFEKVMEFPVYTNELIKAISEEYQKVYDAENASFTYEFTTDEEKQNFDEYIESINFWQNWKNKSSDAMLRNINSILVVDMPTDAAETTPYYYFLDIDSVKDISIDREGNILWLIVEQEGATVKDKTYFILDEVSYRIVDKDGNEKMSVSHGLNYTPACFFWSEPMKKSAPIVKRSPITPALNNLNWLLFSEVSRRCLELYAAYPIYVTFKEKCNYSTIIDNREVYCTGGVLDLGNGSVNPCPVCSKNKFVGPGTLLKVPMPMPADKPQPNNIDAVKQIPAEVASLDYWTARVSELWDEIFYDCVGNDSTVVDKQAINQDQVKAHFSSQENILFNIKENLEKSHQFVINTIARLKFSTTFVSSSINYGTDFYLKSSSEIITEYTEAKTAGVPQYFLNYKRSQIDSIATKGNNNDTERLMILKHLEPWIDLSLNECKALGLSDVSREMFLLKSDFSRLILKFENEFGPVTNFGSLLNFNIKIQRIQQKLLQYVKEEYGTHIEQQQQIQQAAVANAKLPKLPAGQ